MTTATFKHHRRLKPHAGKMHVPTRVPGLPVESPCCYHPTTNGVSPLTAFNYDEATHALGAPEQRCWERAGGARRNVAAALSGTACNHAPQTTARPQPQALLPPAPKGKLLSPNACSTCRPYHPPKQAAASSQIQQRLQQQLPPKTSGSFLPGRRPPLPRRRPPRPAPRFPVPKPAAAAPASSRPPLLPWPPEPPPATAPPGALAAALLLLLLLALVRGARGAAGARALEAAVVLGLRRGAALLRAILAEAHLVIQLGLTGMQGRM